MSGKNRGCFWVFSAFLYFFIDNTVAQDNALFFSYWLELINQELVRNPNRKDKFVPVCLDNCSLDKAPAMQTLLQTYNIPSKIDDLVIELLGETRRKPNMKWPILEFDDEEYKCGKIKLTHALNKLMKKNQHPRLQKKSSKRDNSCNCMNVEIDYVKV